MRLVATSDLQEDTTLARDILTGRDAAPLLRAGVKLNARFIEHLHRAGVLGVYVEDQYSQGIDSAAGHQRPDPRARDARDRRRL